MRGGDEDMSESGIRILFCAHVDFTQKRASIQMPII
jgi:hypothetical protein